MRFSIESRFFADNRDHIEAKLSMGATHLDYLEWMLLHNFIQPFDYCGVLLAVIFYFDLAEEWDDKLIALAQASAVANLIQSKLHREPMTDRRRDMLHAILLKCPHEPEDCTPLSHKYLTW